ncbi:MAG: sigma factor-like helix-turn-helix DNA-binding protein [bacterium]|nr:sigma factor-like helix-turn-helix DNA-binding protein [bacterium]
MANQTLRYFASLLRDSHELNAKEKDILLRRLKNQKLRKIGRKYKVTAERIRQIEEHALQKFTKKILQLLLLD